MRRILATSIAAAIPAVLPVHAAYAYSKPAPQPVAGGHYKTVHAHGHTHASHGRAVPAGEMRNRPGRRPENDVKVSADDGGPADEQGAPEATHGAPAHSAHGRPARPARNASATRPGTGADSGFSDVDDLALPPEAAEAVKEAQDLQNSAHQPTEPGNAAPGNATPGNATPGNAAPGSTAPQGGAPAGAPAQPPAGAPGAAPAAPAGPRGTARAPRRTPDRVTTDESTNQASHGGAGRTAAHRPMPVAFFNGLGGKPAAQSSRLVLRTSTGTSAERTVTLQCDPPGGTHPKAAEACADVAKAGGNLALMPASENPRACFMIYSPVTVTAQGAWQGQAVRFTKKFPNTCVMHDKTGSVFDF